MNDDEIQTIIDLLDSYRIALDNTLYKGYQPAEMTEELGKIHRSIDLLETLHSGSVPAPFVDPEFERLLAEEAELAKYDVPVVSLPGSDKWTDAYEAANGLDKLFPGNDAWNFTTCINYNDRGPIAEDWSNIASLDCLEFGEHDGEAWVWSVVLTTDERWHMRGSCDYTGWDCQSSNTWTKVS